VRVWVCRALPRRRVTHRSSRSFLRCPIARPALIRAQTPLSPHRFQRLQTSFADCVPQARPVNKRQCLDDDESAQHPGVIDPGAPAVTALRRRDCSPSAAECPDYGPPRGKPEKRRLIGLSAKRQDRETRSCLRIMLRKVRRCVFSVAKMEEDKDIGNWTTLLATAGISRIIRSAREAVSSWLKPL